jgi:hypothetical protein
MHLLNMFYFKRINKIFQSGNITHPLTLRICPFECFQCVLVRSFRSSFIACIIRFVYRSFCATFVSCIVRLVHCSFRSSVYAHIQLFSERTNYTNETQTSEKRKTNERYTQTKRTKNANDTKYLLT